MAYPRYIGKSTFESGTGALTLPALTGTRAGDIIILFVESANQTINTPTGYSVLAVQIGTGTAAAAGGVRIATFYRILGDVADTSTTVADSGDHTTAIKMLFRDTAFFTGNLYATATSTQAATTAMVFPSVTTLTDESLVVLAVAQDTDAASTATVGALTNANLSNLTERHDQTVIASTGGGLAVITGEKATAGSTGTSTATGSTSVTHAYTTISLSRIAAQTTTTDFNALTVNSTDYYPVSDAMRITAGSSGNVSATASGTFQPITLTTGTYATNFKWYWRQLGTDTWTTSTAVASTVSAVVTGGTLDTVGEFTDNETITGLTNGVEYEVALFAAKATTYGTEISFSATATISLAAAAITGTLAVTETGSDTFASNGDVIVSGSLNVTESGSDTFVSTGDVIVQGSLSVSETGSDTFASTGDVIVQGSLAVTESGSDTFVSDADLIVQGSLSVAESGSDTFVSDGNVIIQGAMSATESGSDTLVSDGNVFVQGILAATESDADIFAADGIILIQGSLSTTEDTVDTFAASGTVGATGVSGTLSATESGSDTITSSGTVLIQGSISATEETTDTVVSSGIVLVNGTLTATEENSDTLASNGSILVQGSLTVTESGSDTFVSNGNVVATGNLAVTEDTADTFAATGVIPRVGNLAVTESGSDTIVSTGKLIVAGTLSAIETGSDALVANGTVTASPILGSLSAQESGQDTVFVYGFTLAPQPIVEYNVRLFDSMRSPGNLRGAYKSLRGLEHMMWDRILQQCVYNPNVYVTADDPDTWRIGYGRPVTKSFAVEEAELKEARESVWLRSKLTNLYKRVASANPTAELSDVLLSTLYYYHVENQKR